MFEASPNDVIETVIIKHEGGWAFTDRADDSGGATYGGMTWDTFNRWQQRMVDAEEQYDLGDFYAIGNHKSDGPVNVDDDVNKGLRARIRQCYFEVFWLEGRVDFVHPDMREMYLSAIINMGQKEAVKCIQLMYNDSYNAHGDYALVVDGKFGPKTAAAVTELKHDIDDDKNNPSPGPTSLDVAMMSFSDACIRRYVRIVQRNARQWRAYADGVNKGLSSYDRPNVLQSENLMGWVNRAISYRD